MAQGRACMFTQGLQFISITWQGKFYVLLHFIFNLKNSTKMLQKR